MKTTALQLRAAAADLPGDHHFDVRNFLVREAMKREDRAKIGRMARERGCNQRFIRKQLRAKEKA